MFHDPIQQSSFKADVFSGFFAFDPFMLQNFRALCEELLVERRLFDELRFVCFRRGHVRFFFHKISSQSTPNSTTATNQTPELDEWIANLFRLRYAQWMPHYGNTL